MLGGDTAVNGLVWVRGHKEEYDAVERLGSEGWNWENLYQYMKKVTISFPYSCGIEQAGLMTILSYSLLVGESRSTDERTT